MNKLRKVFRMLKNGMLEFLGLKVSTTGETRDIVYIKWSKNRNQKRLLPSAGRKKPTKTFVVYDYQPPKEIHHSAKGFNYNIADRKCKRWTDEEWEYAKELHSCGKCFSEIAEELERTVNSVSSKFKAMKRKGVI